MTAPRVLMTGNDAVGEAAIRAGCDSYFGYPITPQNEITAYMSEHMPAHGRVFIQAESEVAAINMVYGASVAGKRSMTSSSSPGISLKQEGISYLAASELPAVIVNVQRGGPGLGSISPAQADYFQATRGGGHGDYHTIVLAPSSVQEMFDLTALAFDLADRHRTPVIVLSDGRIGQMSEAVTLPAADAAHASPVAKDWALTGAQGRAPRFIRSLLMAEGELEAHNIHLQEKYRRIAESEVRCEERGTEGCDVLCVAYGTSARIVNGCLERAARAGIHAGLLRPITLWPFPIRRVAELAARAKGVLAVEMSAGQMVEDVRLAVGGRVPVHLIGRMGGSVPRDAEILDAMERIHRA